MEKKQDFKNYMKIDYNKKSRFISYWYQINEILNLKPSSILEVGIGTGFVSDYLRKWSFKVTSVDIEPRLNPNVVGDIQTLPFKDNNFIVAVAFEVLEHFPFEKFDKLISELKRVSKEYLIISLPDVSKVYKILFNLPFFGEVKFLLNIPVISKPKTPISNDHYWEIGTKLYSLERIKEKLKRNELIILKNFRIFENTYHRIFVLKKIGNTG